MSNELLNEEHSYSRKLDYVEIGQLIRRYRKKKGLTQRTVSEKVGLTEQHYSHIELGTTKLSLPALLSISDALEVDVNRLLGRNSFVAKHVLCNELAELLQKAEVEEIDLCIRICRAAIQKIK